MAYIGKPPVNGFHTKQSLSGDGSTTSFALSYTVADPSSLIVSVGGVLQEPGVAYTLSGGGANIVFTGAPSSTDTVYVHFLGTAVVQNLLDCNGAEFILDANGNTSITADTDDEIDIKIGGTDRSTIKATGYHNLDSIKFVAGTGDDMQMYHDGTNSYLTNATGALKIATETSGIALTIGHTTSEVTFGDNVTVTGNLTIGGTTSFGDFDITNVGSLALDTITNDGTDITLDSSGDIVLDAGGNDVVFKDSGTTIATHSNSSSDYVIQTAVSDKDFIIKGNDGGSTITPLTLDMSAGGDLFLTGGLIDLKNDGSADSHIKFYCDTGNHAQTLQSAPHTDSATNTLLLPGGSNSYLVSLVATQTLTNKTLTAPKINEDVAVTSTATEINLIDGGTSRGTDAVASGDGLLVNDGGTMKMTNVDTVSTYFSSHNVGGGNIVTTGALASGSIAAGFGAIDNGTSGIRTNTFTAETAFVPDASGGADLGTTSLEFNDAFFNDSAVINFGDDQDTTLTHTDGTGLTLNSTNKLCFNDASQFVQGSSATVLSLGATDEIDLTATAIDINGTCDVSGTLTNASVAVNVAGKQTMWIPANSMNPTESNGCSNITAVETTASRPDMQVLDFDKDSDEFAQFTVAFPKQWNLGTITYQVFWSPGAAATTGVNWRLQGVAFGDNDVIDTDYGTSVGVDDDAQNTIEELLVTDESGAVTIAGSPADDQLCYFRIFRDVSQANDDHAADARLHGVKIFYTTDAANDA